MFLLPILPFSLPGWEIHDINVDEGSWIMTASPTSETAICPACQQVSARVHSHYLRAPHDLPVSGQTVRLQLRVRLLSKIGMPLSADTLLRLAKRLRSSAIVARDAFWAWMISRSDEATTMAPF